MEKLWDRCKIVGFYHGFPLFEVSDKRVQHYSNCFNQDDPVKKNQVLGQISAQYEKEFARQHVLELAESVFKHDLNSIARWLLQKLKQTNWDILWWK